jgi:transposase-like protein
MSAADRRETIARARRLRTHGRSIAEIARALGVVPEVVEEWLGNSLHVE